jgi:hypothetical protein
MPVGLRVAMGALLAVVLFVALLAGFCFSQPGAQDEVAEQPGTTASP